jgi:regulator of sigma E protease
MIGWYLIGILGLALLMVVHEGGHFLAARAYGMRVTKFSIGFGPTFFRIVPEDGYFWFTTAAGKIRLKLFRHDPEKHGPTIYQVAMIPFLAYVQIAGMNPLEEVDPKDKGSYANASLIGRVVTIFGGPFANYLFASVLFFVSFFFGGKVLLSTEVAIVEGRPAAAAQMKTGDKVVEVAGTPTVDWEQMAKTVAAHPGETIPIVVERGGERLTLQVTTANEGGRGRIGVSASGKPSKVAIGLGEAAVLALEKPAVVVYSVAVSLGQYATGQASGELSGPAGIVREAVGAAKSGWTDLVFFLGALSAYLGAFNLVPFPALDGGRLVFLGYEAATRRRPNARVEAHVHAIGLVMMLSLMVYVTVANDLKLGGSK